MVVALGNASSSQIGKKPALTDKQTSVQSKLKMPVHGRSKAGKINEDSIEEEPEAKNKISLPPMKAKGKKKKKKKPMKIVDQTAEPSHSRSRRSKNVSIMDEAANVVTAEVSKSKLEDQEKKEQEKKEKKERKKAKMKAKKEKEAEK